MNKEETREAITLEHKGEKIFGILHRPLNAEKTPAILFCQGFGGNKCGKLDIYVSLAKELTKRGFSVFRFDYRGTGDSEGNSKILTLEDKIEDAIVALKFIESDSHIDSSKIGVFGRSLGGAIALLAARRYGNVKTFALWAPVFNGEQWLELWKSLKQDPSNVQIKQELKKIPGEIPNESFLKQLFALNVTESLVHFRSIPLLHIHGEMDQVVKKSHTEEYRKVCKDFPNKKFVQLAEASHDFAFSPDRPIAEQETIEWFVETLR